MDKSAIFEIALRLVERGRSYNKLVESKAPSFIIKNAEKLLENTKEAVAKLAIDEEVFVAAREYAEAQWDKIAAVEKSLLGELLNALERQRTYVLGITTAPKLFGDEACQEDWRSFLAALDEGNKEQILDNIWKLLIAVKWDVVRTNFQPMPYYDNVVM